MKKGQKVILRAVEPKDLQQLKEWRNYEYFKRNFREYLDINDYRQNKWYENEVNNNSSTIMFSIVSLITDELLGCCGLTYINWINKNADFSFYYGKNLEYIDNEGLSLEAANILLDYGFNQLNLHKIWTEIYEFDQLKRDFLNNIGFSKDAEIRDNYYYDGKYWSSYIYSILKKEFN